MGGGGYEKYTEITVYLKKMGILSSSLKGIPDHLTFKQLITNNGCTPLYVVTSEPLISAGLNKLMSGVIPSDQDW